MRAKWEEAGRTDASARALKEAARILIGDNPAVFSFKVDKQLRARFRNLVPGDAKWIY
jgi:trimethylamine:corrinoid methyltransferase-like protein